MKLAIKIKNKSYNNNSYIGSQNKYCNSFPLPTYGFIEYGTVIFHETDDESIDEFNNKINKFISDKNNRFLSLKDITGTNYNIAIDDIAIIKIEAYNPPTLNYQTNTFE